MTLGLFVMWVVVGLGVGWLAGFVMKSGGYGLKGDLILGLVGSIVGSWLFWALGSRRTRGWSCWASSRSSGRPSQSSPSASSGTGTPRDVTLTPQRVVSRRRAARRPDRSGV